MDSLGWVISLDGAEKRPGHVGGKAATLGRLRGLGFRVPPGFVVPVEAYRAHILASGLEQAIAAELGRKDLASMRWEELWDAALRLRRRFLAAPLPPGLGAALLEVCERLGGGPVAVRSSALAEDGAGRSFAGLHESVVGVSGEADLADAVRTVWASLWSDAALLYRRELGLDPRESAMAVLLQPVVARGPSGVAFARDPRDPSRHVVRVEAVPGPCGDLVGGGVDPDAWELEPQTGAVITTRRGERPGAAPELLDDVARGALLAVLREVEVALGYPPDLEWTGVGDALTVLQARPITAPLSADPEAEDRRGWYLSLRPGDSALRELARGVGEERIPALRGEGEAMAARDPAALDDGALADEVAARRAALAEWSRIYWDEFIPLAHGVRRLGTYYNDAVRPQDPYEFLGLLRGEPLLARRRDRLLDELATALQPGAPLREAVVAALADVGSLRDEAWAGAVAARPGGEDFLSRLEEARQGALDVAYEGARLGDDLRGLLTHLLRRAEVGPRDGPDLEARGAELEAGLLAAVGPARAEEARGWLEVGRLSWRLRDDDNLLLGRIESQLLRALDEGVVRLRARVTGSRAPTTADAAAIEAALRDPEAAGVELLDRDSAAPPAPGRGRVRARQLVGQPAAPGVARGPVRCIRGPADLPRVNPGDVLVCDAIEPAMTWVVPLVAAIVERRGGMLIHGSIIARELGIPCVNGVEAVTSRLVDGDLVIVDGHMGLVTVGPPELDREAAGAA